MSRLRDRYQKEVAPTLKKEFGYKNVMAIPRIEKVIINMGLGEATQNAKVADTGADEIGRITGQKAVVRRATKSIAQFKLRQGMPVGAMVTLRGARMYEFLDRLFSIALPRVRDFRGVSPKGFDGRGNYTLGLRDQLLFPEIDYMKADKARGMNVSVVTTARTDEGSAGSCSSCWACRSERTRAQNGGPCDRRGLDRYGHDCEDRQGSQGAEIQGPPAQPLQAVRPAEGLHAQVLDVPPLLPQAGARRRRHGGNQEFLVDPNPKSQTSN